jgi:membrane-bound lytic murein transglycosylase D
LDKFSEEKMINKKILALPTLLAVGFLSFTTFTAATSCANIQEIQRDTFQMVSPPPIPENLSFVGEKVPLQNFDVKENLDREIMVNSFFHSQTIRYLKLAPRYFSIIEPILKQDSIPDDFKYLALAESGFDPRVISRAGAAGIWQFLKGTGKENGLEINEEVDERFNIEKATHAACKYLRSSYRKYGNWTLVAASYNTGRDNIDKFILKQKVKSYYDLYLVEETNRYVYRIMSLKLILESPEKYGFFVPDQEKYPVIPFETVEIKGAIPDLATFAQKQGTNYKMLKMFNPWLRDSFLKNPTGKTYKILIPRGNYREY